MKDYCKCQEEKIGWYSSNDYSPKRSRPYYKCCDCKKEITKTKFDSVDIENFYWGYDGWEILKKNLIS